MDDAIQLTMLRQTTLMAASVGVMVAAGAELPEPMVAALRAAMTAIGPDKVRDFIANSLTAGMTA